MCNQCTNSPNFSRSTLSSASRLPHGTLRSSLYPTSRQSLRLNLKVHWVIKSYSKARMSSKVRLWSRLLLVKKNWLRELKILNLSYLPQSSKSLSGQWRASTALSSRRSSDWTLLLKLQGRKTSSSKPVQTITKSRSTISANRSAWKRASASHPVQCMSKKFVSFVNSSTRISHRAALLM